MQPSQEPRARNAQTVAIKAPTDLCEIDRQIVHKGGLYEFVKLAWPLVESETPFSDNWHIKLVCDHLEAVSRGEIKRLVVNIPPGCMKSLLVGVFWPAWDWIHKRGRRWMYTSFDGELTKRDAQRTRELVTSQWFQMRWGKLADKDRLRALGLEPVWVLEASSDRANTNKLYWTNKTGMRFATSFEGKATGWHCHIQVVDDPTNPTEIQKGGDQARRLLENTITTWKGTFASRKADPKSFARVIVMQRLHELDLAGHEMENDPTYVKVILPMNFDPARACKTRWGEDPRTVKGELLWEDRYDAPSVATTRKDLGSLAAAAQLDQSPSPESGEVFKREWMGQRWKVLPAGCEFTMSVDASFKGEADSDYVAIHIWARHKASYYLADRTHERMSFTEAVQAIRDMADAWPQARKKLIEAKANGEAIMNTLQNELIGIHAVEPLGGKRGRARASSAYWEAGNVFLPYGQPWVEEFIKQHVNFPTAAHDDDVDAGSQYILDCEGRDGNKLAQAMQKVRAYRLGVTEESKSSRVRK